MGIIAIWFHHSGQKWSNFRTLGTRNLFPFADFERPVSKCKHDILFDWLKDELFDFFPPVFQQGPDLIDLRRGNLEGGIFLDSQIWPFWPFLPFGL